jgi:hypothetical protein
VRACVRACARARASACACVWICVKVGACVRACVRACVSSSKSECASASARARAYHAVAEDVGIGSATGGVALQHGIEDAGPILLNESDLRKEVLCEDANIRMSTDGAIKQGAVGAKIDGVAEDLESMVRHGASKSCCCFLFRLKFGRCYHTSCNGISRIRHVLLTSSRSCAELHTPGSLWTPFSSSSSQFCMWIANIS